MHFQSNIFQKLVSCFILLSAHWRISCSNSIFKHHSILVIHPWVVYTRAPGVRSYVIIMTDNIHQLTFFTSELGRCCRRSFNSTFAYSCITSAFRLKNKTAASTNISSPERLIHFNVYSIYFHFCGIMTKPFHFHSMFSSLLYCNVHGDWCACVCGFILTPDGEEREGWIVQWPQVFWTRKDCGWCLSRHIHMHSITDVDQIVSWAVFPDIFNQLFNFIVISVVVPP